MTEYEPNYHEIKKEEREQKIITTLPATALAILKG